MVDGRPDRPRDSQDKRERLGPRLLHSRYGRQANCSDPQEMGLRPRLLRDRNAQPSLRPLPSLVLRDQPRQHRKERSQVPARLSARPKQSPAFYTRPKAKAWFPTFVAKVQLIPEYSVESTTADILT